MLREAINLGLVLNAPQPVFHFPVFCSKLEALRPVLVFRASRIPAAWLLGPNNAGCVAGPEHRCWWIKQKNVCIYTYIHIYFFKKLENNSCFGESPSILLMEEILHHPTCMKPCKLIGYLPYQLVQDFFHQQYQRPILEDLPPMVRQIEAQRAAIRPGHPSLGYRKNMARRLPEINSCFDCSLNRW